MQAIIPRLREKHAAEIKGLHIEIKRLREVLRWYGDEKNYHRELVEPIGPYYRIEIMADGGERAREAAEA